MRLMKTLLFAGAVSLFSLGPVQADPTTPNSDAGCISCTTAAPIKIAQLNLPPRAVGAIKEQFEQVPIDRDVITVCCPPITQQSFASYFRVHQLPGKNITQTYGLDFLPTAALDTQMKAFAPFAGLFSPYPSPNSVHLDAEMKELNVPVAWNATSAAVTETAFNASTTSVYQHSLRAWWTVPGSGIWNGPHNDFGNHPWEQNFQDGKHVSPAFMQPNKWYVIKLTLKLASKDRPDDQSWHINNMGCMKKFVAIRVQSAGFKVAGGGAAPSAASGAEIIDLK